MNAVVPEIVAAAKLRPGAPVVSISTYVELPVCSMGVAEFDGVGRGVPLTVLEPVAVPLGLFDGVPERVLGGVPVAEEPPDAVPVGVSLPLGAAPVGDPLTVREPLGVLELVRVPDGVPEGVRVGEGVPDDEAPPDSDGVAEGVWEGVGSVTPITNRGPAYIVPALVTESHTPVGNVPAVVPVHTLVSVRMP